jgi:hypothetical protein
VGAAAADVASHGGIDVSVAGVRILGQQSRGGHDLATLAVAALHDLKFAPGVLDELAGRGIAKCFDGDNFFAGQRSYRRNAGAGRTSATAFTRSESS